MGIMRVHAHAHAHAWFGLVFYYVTFSGGREEREKRNPKQTNIESQMKARQQSGRKRVNCNKLSLLVSGDDPHLHGVLKKHTTHQTPP